MTLDTALAGDAAAVRGVAGWLRTGLGPGATGAADDLHAARNTAAAGWRGSAGEAFGARIGQDARGADDLAAAAAAGAAHVEEIAAGLQRAQAEMAEIRRAAADAGLTVHGATILDPGSPAPDPGPAPSAAAPIAMQQAHVDAVAEAERRQRAAVAYQQAVASVGAVRDDWHELLRRISARVGQDLRDKWFVSLGDVGNVVAAGGAATNASILRRQAGLLSEQAQASLARTRLPGATLDRRLFYSDLDDAARLARESDAVAVRAAAAAGYDTGTGLKLGGGLALAGIAYDIGVNDKPVVQAVAGGAGGFAAGAAIGGVAGAGTTAAVAAGASMFSSVATSAAIGASAGPVGAVVGGLVGLGVGLFASGAIDEMFENGPSLEGAASAGWEAVGGTARAVGDVATDAWDKIF